MTISTGSHPFRHAVLFAVFLATGCKSSEPSAPPDSHAPQPVAVRLSPDRLDLEETGRAQVTAQATAANGIVVNAVQFTWSSDATSVATVSASGAGAVAEIIARGPGETKIRVAAGSIEASVPVVVRAAAARLELVDEGSRLERQGLPGRRLPQDLVLRARDSRNQPVAGALVRFVVTAGGGRFDPDSVRSGADGRLVAPWTLGPEPELNAARARLANGFELTLSVRAIPPDEEGTVFYVTDFGTNRVIRFTDFLGSQWTTGPTVPGLTFNGPWHFALDASGRIYVADRYNDRIVRMDDISGNGWKAFPVPAGAEPKSVAVAPNGQIYVTFGNDVMRVDDLDGRNPVILGARPGAPPLFHNPKVIVLDAQGRMLVTDTDNHRIVRFNDMQGNGFTTFGSRGSGVGQFNRPEGLAIDAQGRIYVTDNDNHRIVRIDDMTGAGWIAFGRPGNGVGELTQPHDIAVKGSRIYISDTNNMRLVRIDDMSGRGWVTFGRNGAGAANTMGLFTAAKGLQVR